MVSLIAVSREVFEEMEDLGFAIVQTSKVKGRTIVIAKSFRVCNEFKNSKAKSYYVQEDLYVKYLKKVEQNKK
jgi:predicted DNA-binding protein